mmetsp:Transcript_22144/g.30886  ORF Transcript_22144/g.30886 Transcript_22144/m.30886 type:complete len:242 (-) Transcript_22144:1041-1766(-)
MKKKHLSKKRFGTLRRGSALADIHREIAIMKKLHHRNILHLHEVINDPKEDRLFMVMEYADGGTVMKGELEVEPLPERKAKAFITDVINGLEYMHSNKIIHRDIKPENLVLVGDTVKIGDFGVSLCLDNECGEEEELKKSVGSPAFLPPELCASEVTRIRGPPLDVWSLGITLYFFIFGKLPFTGDNQMQMYENIRTQEVTFPRKIDPNLEDLLKRMLVKDPDHRVTIEEVQKHPWIISKS